MDITRRQAFGPPSQLSREQLALDNSPEILGITGAFFAAAAIAVLLRCYVRIHMLRIFGIDDWVMVAAMVLCTATFVGFVVRVHFGLGHHFIVMLMVSMFDLPLRQRLTWMTESRTLRRLPQDHVCSIHNLRYGDVRVKDLHSPNSITAFRAAPIQGDTLGDDHLHNSYDIGL